MRSVAVRSFVVSGVATVVVLARVSVFAVTVTVVIPEVMTAETSEVVAAEPSEVVMVADVTALRQAESVVVQPVSLIAAVVTVAATARGIGQRGVEAGQRH